MVVFHTHIRFNSAPLANLDVGLAWAVPAAHLLIQEDLLVDVEADDQFATVAVVRGLLKQAETLSISLY